MFKVDFVTLFASFGTFQGVFFSVLIWLRQGKAIYNRIFAVFLLVTSIRIAKNIVVHARDLDPGFQMPWELWRFLVNFGIAHQFAIGPLFLLYFYSRIRDDFRFKRSYLWHFLPYLLLALTSPWQPWAFWKHGGLWASYLSILIYYLVAVKIFYQTKGSSSIDNFPELKRWLQSLLIIAGLLMVAYSPALFKYIGYIGGSLLYAIGIYGVSVMVLTNGQLYPWFRSKYNGSTLNRAAIVTIAETLQKLMTEQRLFTDSGLALKDVASQIGIAPHRLSQVINKHYGMSFSDYVNQFRIEAAKSMLTDPEKANLKIAAIAYDCGFGALSSFNTIFRKHTGQTPSNFRKKAH